jgi:GTPase-associated protein 1, N-terminal domain type 2
MIEQAIFTSAQTDRLRGYQLVAASPGVSADEARDLATWGPSHGSLCSVGDEGSSVNFHPLASGRWCVAETIAAGEEYSGRGGARVSTHSFILVPKDLARFANNPFAVLRAVRNRGLLKITGPLPPTNLASFELPGQVAAVDDGILAEFVERWGGERIAWLLETVLAADTVVIVGAENRNSLLAGLLNFLPAECRPEVSFATGLVHSLRRPFRINALEVDEIERRRLRRQPGVTLVDLEDEPQADFCPSGWAAYVYESLAIDGLALVSAELERPRAGLRLSDLSWLADQLTQRLHATGSDAAEPSDVRDDPPQPSNGYYRKADSAHARFASKLQLAPADERIADRPERAERPSAMLAAPSLDVLERLERLDDLVFDTINGRRPALEELAQSWPRLSAELPAELLAESREQYLRYAIKLWESCLTNGVRDPSWAVGALDVLCVLFGGE